MINPQESVNHSNKDDYIDEITKQNNPNIQDGETILKLD